MSDATKFWMVWRENSPTTRHRHMTKASADREAERLAALNPGEVFYVLKTVTAMVAEPSPIKRLRLSQDEIPF